MTSYIFKRLLYFLPTLFVVSLITFGLSNMAPGDPVSLMMGEELSTGDENLEDRQLWLEEYRRTAKENNFDKPTFYFSILPKSYPDTLYRILPISNQQQAKELIRKYGDWALVSTYLQKIDRLHEWLIGLSPKPENYTKVNRLVNQLSLVSDEKIIQQYLDELVLAKANFAQELSDVGELNELFAQMKKANRADLLRPKFVWNGFQNQYHLWFSGILQGDFGISSVDKKKVSDKIWSALPNTLLLNLCALMVAIIFGFLLGVYLSRHPNHWFARIMLSKIYVVLAMPSFWLATLLVVFLTTPDYGAWTNIFPSDGLGHFPQGASLFQRIQIRLSHLVLPVLSIALPIVGVIALQLRRGLVAEMKKPYIKTAYLKGISNQRVVWGHGVRNALFPILTMFGNVLPGLIGGSIAIELIFNIPGMGRLLFMSIVSKDWSVVFAVMMMTAILTILGLLLMDVAYMMLNPQVQLSKKIAHE